MVGTAGINRISPWHRLSPAYRHDYPTPTFRHQPTRRSKVTSLAHHHATACRFHPSLARRYGDRSGSCRCGTARRRNIINGCNDCGSWHSNTKHTGRSHCLHSYESGRQKPLAIVHSRLSEWHHTTIRCHCSHNAFGCLSPHAPLYACLCGWSHALCGSGGTYSRSFDRQAHEPQHHRFLHGFCTNDVV